MKKKIILSIICVVLAILILPKSGGGLDKCIGKTGLSFLQELSLKETRIWSFGLTKDNSTEDFRFAMDSARFSLLQERTKSVGFTDWERGDGQIGDFCEFDSSTDPLFSCERYNRSKDERTFLFYRPSTSQLDVLLFDNN